MCIPQWSHCGRGVGISCRISIFAFQLRYIKCSLSLPELYVLAGHPSIGHATDFNNRGKETMYVSGPPPTTSTPKVCGMNILWTRSMWWRSDNTDIVTPHSLKLTLVFFCYLNVIPYLFSLHLYSTTPCCPYMNPGVNAIYSVLPRFVCSTTLSNILTTTVSVVCNQMGVWPDIQPFSTYKTMLYSPSNHTNPCCAFCGSQTSIINTLTNESTTTLKTVEDTG